MELELQKFLHTVPDWREKLAATPYCLNIRENEDYILFKYNQFESDMTLQICKEARGIIFEKETLTPVCVPYFKFFNIEESDKADEIDWNSAIIYEKIDGSLMKLWLHNGQWHLSTNGTIDAFTAEVDGQNTTFGDLFVEAIGGANEYNELINHLPVGFCYMFELVHPKTQVVIQYEKPQIYLHGARNRTTLNEVNPFWFRIHKNVKFPKMYFKLKKITPKELTKIVKDMKNTEGVVVRDKDFHRVKIKSLDYLSKAFTLNYKNVTAKTILKLWRNDTLDDFLTLAPEKKDFVDNVFNQMKKYVEYQEQIYCWLPDKHNLSRKEYYYFASEQKDVDITYIMKKYDDKIHNPMEYFDYIGIKNIIRKVQL